MNGLGTLSKTVDKDERDYVSRLIERESHQYIPELFTKRPAETLYFVDDRNGVSVVAIRSRNLKHDQLLKILKYRLVHYVLSGYVNTNIVYRRAMEYESLSSVSPDDVHVLVGACKTGEILCYLTLKPMAETPVGATLEIRDRPLIPLEQRYGWGVYNSLKVLPQLPLSKVWELGRFVKNQTLARLDEKAIRCPIEACVAMYRTVWSSLKDNEVWAILGEALLRRALSEMRSESIRMQVVGRMILPHERQRLGSLQIAEDLVGKALQTLRNDK